MMKYVSYVLNHSLDAAHSLDKMSSIWARPTHSINCRVNGTEALLLDKLSSEWDTDPFAQRPIKRMGLCPFHSTAYQLSGPGV